MVGNEYIPSKQVELQYDSKSGFWYATCDQFQTSFYRSRYDAAVAGNKLALRSVPGAQLINAEMFV